MQSEQPSKSIFSNSILSNQKDLNGWSFPTAFKAHITQKTMEKSIIEKKAFFSMGC